MIRVTRRRVLVAVLALFLFGVGYVAWTFAGMPPVKYYLRYGLDPYCEPTGNQETYEGVEFIEIGPGIFRMGSDYLAEGGDWLGRIFAPFGLPLGEHPELSAEMPVHWVEFRHGFWIAATEVTNAQYERFRPKNERSEDSKGDDTPVVEVSWQDAKDYCAWLSEKSKRPIRLPSEAEWECACRAGSKDEFTFEGDEERLSEYAWFGDEWDSGTRTVATKRPNRWGLSDLHGNVWEWCEDTWSDSYAAAPDDGSPSVNEHTGIRIRRGGWWGDTAKECRAANRNGTYPGIGGRFLGFRPAFSIPVD